MLYVIQCSTPADFGRYALTPCSVAEARLALAGQPFVAAVRHPSAAALLASELRADISPRQSPMTLRLGDAALVLRVGGRFPGRRAFATPRDLLVWPHDYAWLRREA